jgi:hypothetical protein
LPQPARGFGAGAVGVAARRPLGVRSVAGKDEAKDLAMLGPHQRCIRSPF